MKILKLALHWQILIALVAGVIFGLTMSPYASYVTWMGDVFLRALKMIIVPLILSSIITGVAGIGNAENLGRLGIKTMGFYLLTSLMAIITGVLLVNYFQPGTGADLGLKSDIGELAAVTKPISQTLIEIIPDNLLKSFADGNMLSVIFFAILMGFFITRTSRKTNQYLRGFFESIFEVIMKITLFIIRFTPLGIFGIVSGVVSAQANNEGWISNISGSLGLYMLLVVAGILIHGLITMSIILKTIGKLNPLLHLKNMSTVLLTAFSTSSSNATLPLTMSEVENKDGVSNKIASFTLPLGATINMNGTALYECIAVLFIAQAYGIDLNFGQQMIVVLTAMLAAIGSAGIPMAGIVMMTLIMSAVGIPLEGIGLILAVDRPLDMMRTAMNVYGDTCAAAVIAKSEGEQLKV
ncbi:MAG: dicarboxylate/amino acid:cation symporter [Bacteroidales bacterium]|nr:dicarboxylate/amino acid:cation symporter [Bacteroidales bacterium]